MLHWLEADALIRQKSKEKLSLDDFCRRFFGGANRGPDVKPYTEAELVSTLGATLPDHDWGGWLRTRFDALEARAPRDGLELAGWPERLGEVREPSRDAETLTDFRYSLGFQLNREGRLTRIEPSSLAARVGLKINEQLTQLNGQPFTSAALREQIRASKASGLHLLLQVEGSREVRFDYVGGERLSILERAVEVPDRLEQIFLRKYK